MLLLVTLPATVDAVNVPDGPRAQSRMGALLSGLLIQREVGIEAVVHYACRDRNLLGMLSDLLGAAASGLDNLLLITGDPPKMGPYPDATAVFDIDSIGLTNLVARLNQQPPENYCRPAVDVLFRSAAVAANGPVLGLVLTGMGQDGAKGAQHLVDAGGSILAQDRATSVVWGMPGAVAAAGLAEQLLPLGQVAAEVRRRLTSHQIDNRGGEA